MNKQMYKYMEKVARYLHETFQNKFCALALLVAGLLAMKMTGEATAMMILAMFAVPLFFAKKNYFLTNEFNYNEKL